MTRARVAAAMAATLTVLLLQATVIGPATFPWPISLPAVLVATVALVDGPATGMSFGFAVGLVADLGSRHPAGVLALCWLGIGLLCGTLADRRSVRRDALIAGIVCAAAGAAATLLLALVHAGATMQGTLVQLGPSALGDAVLALAVVPLARRMLAAESLRAAHQVYTELVPTQTSRRLSSIGPRRG